MLTRRIAISACALCFVIPAAAGASSTTDPPKAKGPYGTTTAAPSHVVKAKGPYGTTTRTPPDVVKAKGPYGTTTATPPDMAKAKGPYGMTTAAGSQDITTAPAVGASGREGTNGWRTAAISVAALLAALAFGSALLLSALRRTPRMGT